MKMYYIGVIILVIIYSCSHEADNKNTEKSIRKEAMDIAVKYAGNKFKQPKNTIDSDGNVTIEDGDVNFVIPGYNRMKYIINPSKITVGLINDDSLLDAIITISSSKGQYLEMPESLILINSDGRLAISRTIESDMTILGIKDRVITAEILTRSRNSPLRDCEVCREVVKYRFDKGDLVKVE